VIWHWIWSTLLQISKIRRLVVICFLITTVQMHKTLSFCRYYFYNIVQQKSQLPSNKIGYVFRRVSFANPRGRAFRSSGSWYCRPEDAEVLFVRRLGEHCVPDGIHQRSHENSHIADHQGSDFGVVYGQRTR